MQKDTSAPQEEWQAWSTSLKRWGVRPMVGCLLESGGALNILLAQLIYFGQPFMNGIFPTGHLQRIASVLEDKDQAKAFAAYLLEGEQQ